MPKWVITPGDEIIVPAYTLAELLPLLATRKLKLVPADIDPASFNIDPASVRTAGCRGAQLTILVALVIALYFIIRSIVAHGVRKAWKSRDVEGFHTRRPREY